jgi:non-specific serine/threonine protein kinase
MGVVYKAHDSLLDRVVAIKFLNATGMGTAGKARLLQEARAVARLNHPNIVSVYDAGESDGNPFIVMELVDGNTLRHHEVQNLLEALKTTQDICMALDHAHTRGIIHRDLKLENIIVTESQAIKLMDFGLARTSDQAQATEEGTVFGTFAYLAPELIQGGVASPQSDLYALGVIMYELLTGLAPFQGTISEILSQHMHGVVKPPSEHNPNVPAWVDELVLGLLSKRPEERPVSVREVILALERKSTSVDATFQYQISHKTRNNLPAQLNSFIGREKEIEQLRSMINNNRLLTLTGVGGTGKTRLSLQAASMLLDDFSDGVWFVEFASVTTPELMPGTIAAVLQLMERPGHTSLETITEFLETRETLILLDNCEHLIQACANIANHLLQRCSKLKIIATSREPLGVSGETIWSVPSLATPSMNDVTPLAALMEFESVKLFLDRARAAQPNFELDEVNVQAVAQICARLDGIPLALELAAARVRGMNVEQIASRLDNRFRLLTGGSRTSLPRQQTLGALVDWSFNLLSDAEKLLFQRLSVFIGSFNLESAEKICSGGLIEEFDVLDLLQRLVDKSLVVIDVRYGENYYRLLETIRQYGRDKLLASGEAEDQANRHAEYYEALSAVAFDKVNSPDQLEWLRKLGVMHDNLRAALGWILDLGETIRILKFVQNLSTFWFRRSELQESRQWFERVLALPKVVDYPTDYILALAYHARGTWLHLGPSKAKPVVMKALALAREREEKHPLAEVLLIQSLVATTENDFDQGAAAGAEAKLLFQELGNEWGWANALLALALLFSHKGNHAEALSLYREALGLFEKQGDIFFQNVAQRWIGVHEVGLGNHEYGMAALRRSLQTARLLESNNEIALNLWAMANAESEKGNYTRSIRLYFTAKRILDNMRSWDEMDEKYLQSKTLEAQKVLDKAAINTAINQGLAMTLEQAVAYALGEHP